jgi:hypothetical protein
LQQKHGKQNTKGNGQPNRMAPVKIDLQEKCADGDKQTKL